MEVKKTAIETFNLLRDAQGESTLWRVRVFEWHKKCSEGRQDVGDEQPGRQVTMKTDENVEKVRTLVRKIVV